MNIHINLDNKTYEVSTYGGYQWLDDTLIDSFGVQIGDDFSFSINSETALNLINILQQHLKNCGFESVEQKCYDICHRIYMARNISLNQETIIEELKKIDKLLKDNNGHKDNYN